MAALNPKDMTFMACKAFFVNLNTNKIHLPRMVYIASLQMDEIHTTVFLNYSNFETFSLWN